MTPPKRRISTPFTANPGLEAAADTVARVLGAVEMDLTQLPEHWLEPLPEGRDFAIFIDGVNVQRPDFSRRRAYELVQTAIKLRAWLQYHLDTADEKELPRPIRMPQWHGVAECIHCHEVQLAESGQSEKMGQCWACQGRCKKKHRSQARTCDNCVTEMRVIWTTDEDIPEDWNE